MPRKRNNPPVGRSKLKNVGLFIDEEESTNIKNTPTTILLSDISLPPSQPRRYFAPQAMKQLVASISQDGILQPLLVRPLDNGKYELVAGERRYRAAIELELKEVPVHIRTLSDEQVQQYALTENLQREDLNPVEETEAILDLLALKLKIDRDEVVSLLNQQANYQRGLTDNVIRKEDFEIIEAVFKAIGRFSIESFRSNRLPLLNLPNEILTELRQGNIAYTKARAIAKIKDETQRKELLNSAISEGLSLNQIKEKITLLKKGNQLEAQSPQSQVKKISQQLSTAKLWQKEPKKWKKIQGLLNKIEALMEETP